mgnify:CR=1 FL=1
MKKRFLSVIVLSAALLSVQAQEGKGGSARNAWTNQAKLSSTAADKALRNAIGNNDIRKLALNQENMQGMDTHFSIKVESKGITDQKSSGRCWLFTGLNVMRAKTLPNTVSSLSSLRSLSLLLGPVGEGKPLLARHHRHLQESPD